VDCRKAKCIAITFDDGPVRQTATVLDDLKARGARATFFVLGSMARRRPALLRRMVAEGHAIGNHSWNHPQFFKMSSKAVRKQIRATAAVIRRATGKAPALMRPPFGEQNARIRRTIRGFDDPVILWNIDTQDWKYRNTKRLVSYVRTHAKRNAIVLMHDIRPTTRAAVPAIVDELQAKGFTLVTVPELLRGRLKPGRVYTRG
jgi:peptidoglycan/xylan/chitin deacetylase (PgdA/CDA1 family)